MARRNVLVVEDEAAIREIVCEILSWAGYDVRTARNGREALDLLRHAGQRPDVIVLDITMPVTDGVTFRRTPLRDPELSRIPVIVASAVVPVHALPETRQLQKPFRLAELLAAIQEALDSSLTTYAAA